eukprot:scaffold2782_cov29-Tisochrysis_lutea.AAC.1
MCIFGSRELTLARSAGALRLSLLACTNSLDDHLWKRRISKHTRAGARGEGFNRELPRMRPFILAASGSV